MEVIELKFILKLLGFEGYRAPIRKIQPNSKTKAPERDRICRTLGDRGYVGYEEDVTKFKIESPGKQILKTDTSQLPIAKDEVKVLQVCAQKTANPGDTKLPKEKRQPVIRQLIERGFVRAVKKQIKEVWLTEEGKQYLLEEYAADSTAPSISTKLLTKYLQFMREAMQVGTTQPVSTLVSSDSSGVDTTAKTRHISDEDILQITCKLDRELGTRNYLPIYQLRQKLQPPMSRDELDRALFRLQRNNKIELSSLQEAMNYSKEQIEAAIHSEFEGILFFIIVT